MRTARDITGRGDLDTLLRDFYAAAVEDSLIGPYFTEIAAMDLESHLPRITNFWARALLRNAEYRGNAYAPHLALHAARPLSAAHFGRWVQLWHAAVDGRHAGPTAARAKIQGERIARAMLRRLTGTGEIQGTGPGFVPLAAVRLRSRQN
ncbi:group III truncated hemoglobin [Nocardia huaxiensis]|uniref:group III truncated hemoglobin n=1 Tax=Nocardia huaxiensis TaxID=2755382 RepID=UPI001E3D48BF|nr:group III truncated hemoglobin [Nocardia huaxiensis]UFS98473.1 group III truncated hemoglobin [Nocardia huaxiensis]